MEREQSCSNYGMMMKMSSEQIANCYFHATTNWENNSMDQNDHFESALSSMVSSPTSTTTPPLAAPSLSNGGGGGGDGMIIRELIGRLGSICDDGEISPQKSSIVNNSSTNPSCYSTPLNSPPPSRFSLSSLMIMGNNSTLNHTVNYPANHLGSLNADPGFVERAARLSCFGNNVTNFVELGSANLKVNANVNVNHHLNNGNYCGRSVPKLESGKLSRVNSEKQMIVNNNNNGGVSRGSSPDNGELGDSREGSSVSEQNPGVETPIKVQNDAHNSRKRKAAPKAKVKDAPLPSPVKDDKVDGENEESDAERSKVENEEAKKENAGEFNSCNKEKQNNNSNNNSKETEKPEPPKDYIHVRARRGQATDSHSLAERVRREKISERMKFLQDLVPGCNKVTGKATVLDEIINYVQSLQCQVEFLSMKLATVNPRMEFNMEALLSSKDMLQSRGTSLPQSMNPIDPNAPQAFSYGYQAIQQMPMQLSNGVLNGVENPFAGNPTNVAGIRRNLSVSLPSVDGFTDSMNQLPTLWEDDLHSIVHVGIAQNQTQSVPGAVQNAQMKAEL